MKKSIGRCLQFTGLIIIPLLLNFSCRTSNHADAQHTDSGSAEGLHTPIVETMVLETRDFIEELHSNGRLRAVQRSRLPLRLSGELKSVNVVNGKAVEAGDVLAELCSEDLQRQMERAGLQYIRTRLDMEDILLGQGYHLKDSLSIPEFTWQMAGLRSGYFDARNELKNLENDLVKTRIVAPYNGVVADLDLVPHEYYNAGEIFCTLIDDSDFLLDFVLMESEIEAVYPGTNVIVSPFSRPDQLYHGYIYSVNPSVGKQGQVKVVAIIPGESNLMDGMHARVIMHKNIPGQMVVPKSAVIYRDDEEVLFRVSQGRAEWTYVTILNQNGSGYSVISNPERRSHLEPGDTIIVSNNIHLAHGSPVTPQ
jgi:membrane fusion protein, multidrug efflux system